MFLGFLALFAGLSISAVAIYYSVLGLAAIFAAAVIPIIVMGVVLEVSKLIAAWWLKWNWHRAPFFIKYYLLIAVLILMLITSMGIFGFLSKAHSDQVLPTGEAVATIELFDQLIESEQQRILDARNTLQLLDAQINEFTERGFVTRGVNARAEQQAEREFLANEIANAQIKISQLREQRTPIAAALRELEAEVGPIRYIAQLIYGQSPSTELLERSVVWIIIVIVLVFDPLAVLLLLAAQTSFRWHWQEKNSSASLPASSNNNPVELPEEIKPTINPLSKTYKRHFDKNTTIVISKEVDTVPDVHVKDVTVQEESNPDNSVVETKSVDQEEHVTHNNNAVEKHHIFEDDIKAIKQVVKKNNN